jgi:hypothetical protein
MEFWVLAGAVLVVVLALAWWSDRGKAHRSYALSRSSGDELAARHQVDRGTGALQGQRTRDNIGDAWHG